MPTQIDIERNVAELAGDLRAELAEAIGQAIQQELAIRAPPATPPTMTDTGATTDEPDQTQWVQNERTEAWHIVSVGPGSGFASPQWSAWCGWAFGRSGGFSLETPSPGSHRCPRCIGIAAKRAGNAVGTQPA